MIAALAACSAAPPVEKPPDLGPRAVHFEPIPLPAWATSSAIPLPGPAPRPPRLPFLDIGTPSDEGCARCHQEIAAEQDASLHRHAFQNAYFERAYAAEPTPFCRKCHAPEADPFNEPPAPARKAGVGCVTCHVVLQGVVGVRALPTQKDGHAVLGDPRLATAEACGECHQFDIPAPPRITTGPMQDTLGEHRRSAFADKPCQTCHMPVVPSKGGGTHKSHSFRVQGDKAMLAKGVRVVSATIETDGIHIVIEPGEIGHAFPTGDLYRQVELRVTPLDAAGEPTGATSALALTRTFKMERHQPGNITVNHQVNDTRLTARRSSTFPAPRGTTQARYQIVWQRLPAWLAESLKMNLREHETVVIEGTAAPGTSNTTK